MNYLVLILSEIVIIAFIVIIKLIFIHKENHKVNKVIDTIVDKINTDEETKFKFKQNLSAINISNK